MGQQEKAFRMLQSRKILSVKTLTTSTETSYVKAMIYKSYGHQDRPAVIVFQGDLPVKAFCDCPIGCSGLCCHVLAVLLYLKHFSKTGQKLLKLTCTEQLQKWHRKSNKGGSVPMVKLADLKLKSAKRKKEISAADPDNPYFKRNINAIIKDMNEKLDKMKPVSEHVYSVLSKSKLGQASSVGQNLTFKFRVNGLADHQYCGQNLLEKDTVEIENKSTQIKDKINELLYGRKFVNTIQNIREDYNLEHEILQQEQINITISNFTTVYPPNETYNKIKENINSQKGNMINLDIAFMDAPEPNASNYHDIEQNTTEWLDIRKFKITGSRLPALLGFYGQKKFDNYWDIVINGTNEKDMSKIPNIQRGHQFETEAVRYFEKISKATTSKCGFYSHPSKPRFGSSPDALGPHGILVEIKTRAKDCEGPLENLSKNRNYYVQCQLQMVCTDSHTCILVSYHPESQSANFFAVKRNDALISVMLDVCESIIANEPYVLDTWYTDEKLEKLADLLNTREKLGFHSLKPLRTHITALCKEIQMVKFEDNFDFQMENLS